jgi:Trk-type K+ transport system membrane component
MSWGGAVAAMVSSIKNNTLAKRTKIFDKEHKGGFSSAPTHDKKVSKEALDTIKSEIKTRAFQRKRRQFIALLLSLIITLIVVLIFANSALGFLSKY